MQRYRAEEKNKPNSLAHVPLGEERLSGFLDPKPWARTPNGHGTVQFISPSEASVCWFCRCVSVPLSHPKRDCQISSSNHAMETATMTASSTLHIEIESLPIDRSAGFHQKVLDGIEDLLLVLDQGGRVLYASPKSYPLIQVKPETLVGRYISTCMNVDDIPIFLIDFKENMATGACWRSHHRLRRGDDTYKPFESTFKPYTDIIVDDKTGSKISTKMCLMIARPYQITSTSLMDSFLEHYTTNIRLSNQIARLRGEAEEFDRSSVVTPTAVITVSISKYFV